MTKTSMSSLDSCHDQMHFVVPHMAGVEFLRLQSSALPNEVDQALHCHTIDMFVSFDRRLDKPPSKELIKTFIRSSAWRGGYQFNSPWVVNDDLVQKYSLVSKFADLFVSSTKVRNKGNTNYIRGLQVYIKIRNSADGNYDTLILCTSGAQK